MVSTCSSLGLLLFLYLILKSFLIFFNWKWKVSSSFPFLLGGILVLFIFFIHETLNINSWLVVLLIIFLFNFANWNWVIFLVYVKVLAYLLSCSFLRLWAGIVHFLFFFVIITFTYENVVFISLFFIIHDHSVYIDHGIKLFMSGRSIRWNERAKGFTRIKIKSGISVITSIISVCKERGLIIWTFLLVFCNKFIKNLLFFFINYFCVIISLDVTNILKFVRISWPPLRISES